ncbi:hypothetical protein XENORESO_006603, partial [Xenotaenia resolanae]
LTCQHVNKAVDLSSVKKSVLSSVWLVCSECLRERTMIDGEPAAFHDILVCLKCGFQGCNQSGIQHAVKHHQTFHPESHCITISLSSWKAWCFECNEELSTHCNKKALAQTLDFLQKHSVKATSGVFRNCQFSFAESAARCSSPGGAFIKVIRSDSPFITTIAPKNQYNFVHQVADGDCGEFSAQSSRCWYCILKGPSVSPTLVLFPVKETKLLVPVSISCVGKSWECRRCWCTCMQADELEHLGAFLLLGERLHSVTAAHTRWLSKEGQVVVPSAAQSSVDAAHADICLRRLLQGEERSAFPYACARYNPPLHPLLPCVVIPRPPQSEPDGFLNIVYLG